MTNRCIANEILRLLPHDNLFALVSDCASGLGYYASPIFRNDARLPYQIALFAMDRREETYGNMTEAGSVTVTPIPPNMRIQVFCQAWQTPVDFAPGFTPCEVAAEVMRYLLRMIEGHGRANAWRPPWEKSDKLSDLLKPIMVNWRVSELKRWVEDYAADYGLSIGFFQLVNGIQINQDIPPGALVSLDGQRLEEGGILLTPALNDAARAMPAAIAELRRWRSALEAATAEHRQGLTATAETTGRLSYTEQKIKDAYDRIVSEGELHPTDDVIAAQLPIGRKGQPLTRETVNRYRNRMRKQGIEV